MESPSASVRWIAAQLAGGAAAEVPLSGESMYPALREGDCLLVSPLGARAPRPGEIVVVHRAGRLVAHRLVSLCGGRAVTRGDASAAEDVPVALSEILGRVVAVLRRGRRRAPPARGSRLSRLWARLEEVRWG
jgi:signal peptidase I